MSYTAEDILELLPIVAGPQWRVNVNNNIRDDEDRCPLCALAEETMGNSIVGGGSRYWVACQMLMIDEVKVGAPIACAADYPGAPLRPALMAALGMTP